MTDGQLTFQEDNVAQTVNGAYDKLRQGNFSEAIKLLDHAIELDVEYKGVTATLKCVRFWKERQVRVDEIQGAESRANYLLDQWSTFRGFSKRIEDLPERCFQDIKYFIHATAVAYLLENDPQQKVSMLTSQNAQMKNQNSQEISIGHCYKIMGDFSNAIGYLEKANRRNPNSAVLIAELADCYSLINEPNAAKVLFREAFYLGADQIIIDTLESALIKNLIISIKKEGITQDIEEWLPVYGNISGTFNVKRELKPVEYGRLKQSIFKLESRVNMNPELKENSSLTTTQRNSESSLVPKLINRYFWLIDHYLSTNEKSTKINEILERLKHLDVAIYQKYVT